MFYSTEDTQRDKYTFWCSVSASEKETHRERNNNDRQTDRHADRHNMPGCYSTLNLILVDVLFSRT